MRAEKGEDLETVRTLGTDPWKFQRNGWNTFLVAEENNDQSVSMGYYLERRFTCHYHEGDLRQ